MSVMTSAEWSVSQMADCWAMWRAAHSAVSKAVHLVDWKADHWAAWTVVTSDRQLVVYWADLWVEAKAEKKAQHWADWTGQHLADSLVLLSAV